MKESFYCFQQRRFHNIQKSERKIPIVFQKKHDLLSLLGEGKVRTFLENFTEDDNPCLIRYRLNAEMFKP